MGFGKGDQSQIEYKPVYWNDINVSASALGQGASAPDVVTLIGNIQGIAFDGNATTEQLYGEIEILHDYKEGTDLRPHIHWSPTTANAGNIKWQLEYTAARKGEVFPATSTISVVVAANGVARTHNAHEFPVIPGADFIIGTHVAFRLFRNPADAEDTYPDDALLHSFGVHYEIDTPGSRMVMQK